MGEAFIDEDDYEPEPEDEEEVEESSCPECGDCACCDGCTCNSPYCSGCGFTSCECDQFGKSIYTPWEERGISFKPNASKETWDLVWPDINSTVNPVAAAADFYLLEGIASGVLAQIPGINQVSKIPKEDIDNKFFDLFGVDENVMSDLKKARDNMTKSVDNLQAHTAKARKLLNSLVEFLDPIMVAYILMAIGGELRHHPNVGKKSGRILAKARTTAWCGWRHLFHTVGNEILLDAADLFREIPGGSVGGNKWAEAAELLHSRLENKLGPNETANKQLFLDRVWTLEHNNGCILNKIEWGSTGQVELCYMKKVLNAHNANPVNIFVLTKYATEPIQKFYQQYIDLVNTVEAERGMPQTFNIKNVKDIKICKYCLSEVGKGHGAKCLVARNKSKNSKSWSKSFKITPYSASEINTEYYYNNQNELLVDPDKIYKTTIQVYSYSAGIIESKKMMIAGKELLEGTATYALKRVLSNDDDGFIEITINYHAETFTFSELKHSSKIKISDCIKFADKKEAVTQ